MYTFWEKYLTDADFFVEITGGFLIGFVLVTLCAYAIHAMFNSNKKG